MFGADAKARGLSAVDPLPLRLLPDEGLHFEESLPQSFVAQLLAEVSKGALVYTAQGEGELNLRVEALGPVDKRPPVRLRGKLKTPVKTACVRCLEPVPLELEIEVDTTLMPASGAKPLETPGQGEAKEGKRKKKKVAGGEPLEDWSDADFAEAEALDESHYHGEDLPVPEVLREALLLELSLDPVCADREACDLRTTAMLSSANQEAEQASVPQMDPRWAKLQALKDAADDKES